MISIDFVGSYMISVVSSGKRSKCRVQAVVNWDLKWWMVSFNSDAIHRSYHSAVPWGDGWPRNWDGVLRFPEQLFGLQVPCNEVLPKLIGQIESALSEDVRLPFPVVMK